jgi:ribosomal protein S18 acetylase RimI-like enzyme
MKIRYTEEKLKQAIQDQLDVGHLKYESEKGVEINYQSFSLTAEVVTKDAIRIVGVLNGYTAYAEVYIDDLWVDEAFRQQGYATELIQALELQFKDSLFDYICLCTSEFQAPSFYEKCGFELEFKRTNKRNRKFNKYFFIKSLRKPEIGE